MGRWTDIATWVGTVNEGDGDGTPLEPADHMAGHVGVVLHIAEGTFLGTEAWQQNRAAQVSSHFIVAKDGRVAQMVDTDDRSWCQVAGNSTWLSIEHEGNSGDTLPPAQLVATARIVARAHQVYGSPLVTSDSPTTPGLGYHAMGGTAWGGHFDCPGNPIINQRPAILAAAAQQTLNGEINVPFLDDPNAAALSWRMDALHRGTDTVQGGPTAGEPMWIVKAVKALAAGQMVPPPAVDTHALATDVTQQLVAAGAVGLTADQLHAAVKSVLDGATIHAA